MAAAATVLAIFEDSPQEEVPMPRRPSRPNFDETTEIIPREEDPPLLDESDFAHWSAKQLSVRAINSTLALAQQVGKLTTAVVNLERKLEEEYEDTKTHELRALREKVKGVSSREKWFKTIITAVVTAVAIAEVLRWLGLPH